MDLLRQFKSKHGKNEITVEPTQPQAQRSNRRKTVDELFDVELQELKKMAVDFADIDYVHFTQHGLVIGTGGNRWLKEHFGKKPVTALEVQQLKMDYNSVLAELRMVEKKIGAAVFPECKTFYPGREALMDKLAKIYDMIVRGGHAVTVNETRHGFDIEDN